MTVAVLLKLPTILPRRRVIDQFEAIINHLQQVIDQFEAIIDHLPTVIDQFSRVIVILGPLTYQVGEAL